MQGDLRGVFPCSKLPPNILYWVTAMITQKLIDALPFSQALGMQLVGADGGHVALELPYNTQLVGDPASGVIHGGAVSALLDTCCGVSVMNHPKGTFMTATLDLRIDYMRPATPGQRIVARAECYHVTRSVAFVRAQALDEDEARPVATASAAFTLEHPAPAKGGKA